MRLRKTPSGLNGRDKQPGEPGAGPEPQKLGRRHRRSRERWTEREQRRRIRQQAGTGAQRLDRWRRESDVELVRQGNRLGIEQDGTVQARKRVCIELARTQARVAGVSNSTWACAKHGDRAKMIERCGT